MPNTYYAQLWLEARKDLEKLLADDKLVQDGPLIEERQEAVNIVLELYFRYRRMVQRLTTCHDQIVQVQIRELVGKMLDYSIVRMLECRQEIVNLTFLDCPWPNDLLLDMKLTPDDIELRAPAYEAAAREAEFARRRKVVEDANKMMEDEIVSEATSLRTYTSDADESKVSLRSRSRKPRASIIIDMVPKETPEEKAAREQREAKEKQYRDAISLIQSHERARVGRRIARNAILDRDFRSKLASGELTLRKVDPAEQERAARLIQRCWRGFRARLHYEKRIEQMEELLGMTMPSWRPRDEEKLGQEAYRERLEMQIAAVKQRDAEIEAQRKKIWEFRGPSLVEDVRDEILEWFLAWFEEVGYFDSIPPAEDGGSVLIATGQVRTPAEYLSAPPDDKKKKQSKDKPIETADEDEDDEPEGWQMSESQVYPLLLEANEEFVKDFSERTEEILDPRGRPILELLTEPLYHELQLEMRRVADQQMREQLQALNQALTADMKEDKVPFQVPKPQVFERPPPPPPVKERPDPLADIPDDQLLIELANQDVLRECPQEKLSDWPGAVSYEIRADKRACLGDVLQPVMDYCVLPFGSKRVNKLAPEVRSVCLCGPPGSGQLFIARAICAELKATVFDLTPDRHVGKFLQKSKQDTLVHSVLRLARSYAPSVILVEDESAFLKSVPLSMRAVQPKRFAAIYRKIVKGIKPGDQVLFLTSSQQPYMATRALVNLHDKFIIIPVADYGSLYRACKNALMKQPAVHRHFNVSSIARLLVGQLPLGLAQEAIALTTNIERRIQYKRKPLQSEEILEKLFQMGLPKKQIESFAKFQANLPMEVQRMELELEEAEQEMEKNKNKK